ncbi:MAG TPA: cupredoxin domain-containing protein [Pseudonocardiaceae bacterium]|nr:cupredoxin domain-containing protein [Pseudonocardiaceae bacterium]
MKARAFGALRRSDVGSLRLAVGAAITGVALSVAACSGGGTASAPSSGGASPTASSQPSSQPSSSQVTVQMTDFHLALSQQTFAPGAYTLVAVNSGQTVHAIELNGPGVSDQHTDDVQPGQTARLTVTLQPGSYEMYCPVDGHKTKGMDTHFTVGGAGESTNPSEPGASTGGY